MKKSAVSIALIFAASLAAADPVDNPGDFTQLFDTGRIKIGNLDEMDFSGVSIAGTVLDTDGNIFIPTAGIAVPDIVVPTPLGDVTIHFVSISDGTGSLNAVTGDATFTISLQVFLLNPTLPPGCGVEQLDFALTTGSDGTLTGVLYDMADGTVTYVNNTFSVPVTTGCDFFGPLIDSFAGLPAGPGTNYINNLHGTFSPVFVGS